MLDERAPMFSGARLRDERQRAGLSRMELAARLGRRWSTIERYERDEAVPSALALGGLAHVLGCTIDDLFEVPDAGH
ncbi:MAG TPA: helix-turn-helix transcriptional regulator [Kofleriaceae bacterium]